MKNIKNEKLKKINETCGVLFSNESDMEETLKYDYLAFRRGVILQRKVGSRMHTTDIAKECLSHYDIILELYSNCLKNGVNIFYDDLCDMVVKTY